MIEIYTDGACSGNPGPGGWGIVVVSQEVAIADRSGGEAHTTNNRMELMAAIEAFLLIDRLDLSQTYVIVADSKYVIDGATSWMAGWKKKNWISSSNQPVKNRDLWERLDALMQRHPGVTWRWVKGHSGNVWNDLVDQLAVLAIPGRLPQAGVQ